MSYTKLFSSIVTSTIWTEDAEVCKVWVTMLAIADKHGEVHASIPGLAQITGLRVSVVESAIEKFLSPDPYSRTKDDEGRRIEPIDGGWSLLNHAKYRAMASKDEEKTANAIRQRRFREKAARNQKQEPVSQIVTGHNGAVTGNRDIAEAYSDTEADSNNTPLPPKGGMGRKSDNLPSSQNAIRISQLFSRRLTTKWSAKEIRAFKAIGPMDPEDLELVCRYTEAERAKGDAGKHRRDLLTFLNNFTGEIDRAREKSTTTQSTPKARQWVDEP